MESLLLLEQRIKRKGQDSIFCEGKCQSWVHRRCVGLSENSFKDLSNSTSPFLCPYCLIDAQNQKISSLVAENESLKLSVSLLSSTLTDIQSKLAALQSSHGQSVVQSSSTPPCPNDSPLPTGDTNTLTVQSSQPKKSPSSSTKSDRRFNLLFFGIPELPVGTRYHERVQCDHDSIVSVFDSSGIDLPSNSIRDCLRVGKFNRDHQRPRPLLVKFNSSRDVSVLLKQKHHLVSAEGNSITVKPDLSKADRHLESILLKERRRLINEGVERKAIKIHGNKLLVNSRITGYALSSGFSVCPTLGDHSSSLQDLSNSPSNSTSSSTPHSTSHTPLQSHKSTIPPSSS
jgi:hypothetical protein